MSAGLIVIKDTSADPPRLSVSKLVDFENKMSKRKRKLAESC